MAHDARSTQFSFASIITMVPTLAALPTLTALSLCFVAILKHATTQVESFAVDRGIHWARAGPSFLAVSTNPSSSGSEATTVASSPERTDQPEWSPTRAPAPLNPSSELGEKVLQAMSCLREEAFEYGDMFGLSNADAAFYALFKSIRTVPVPLNLKGSPFVLRNEQLASALDRDTSWTGYFTMKDLERAVTDDFLDAARGSTDNRRGWKITDVSQPRGDSFREARMTYEDVVTALGRGTVIFNAAGAHVPKLAGPTLAACDGAVMACALNLYVTQQGMRTSAPPHTDKQDVVVVQSTGHKHWRVYSPPMPSVKPHADPFGRGKGDDSLPLYSLQDRYGCELLLETVLKPGDALFIPAGFPHTTSTVVESADSDDPLVDEPSIHLTLGIDHHIWELDYLSARRLGLRRAGVIDKALGQLRDDDNPFVGEVNELTLPLWRDLLGELPLGLMDDDEGASDACLREASEALQRLSHAVDPSLESQVSEHEPGLWREVARRFQQEGRELLEIHRDMYLAALEEGRKRDMEEAMMSHLHGPSSASTTSAPVMSPERMQRLSLFRVKRFYDRINESKAALKRWSHEGVAAKSVVSTGGGGGTDGSGASLPADWATTLPVKEGDAVEADLGGAYFSAKVIRVSGGGATFDVQFFDGDVETGLPRAMIRLLSPPTPAATATATATALANDDSIVDPSTMTAKQLKRWKKQQEKLNKRSSR